MSDSVSRLRESLQRTRSGDATARRELEADLRQLRNGQFRDVLARSQEARSRGDQPSAEQLCDGNPAYAPTVAEVIRLVEDAQTCLTATGSAGPTTTADGPLPIVPGYELLSVIGRGGMGIVYQARQLGFNRIVALKMIRSGAGADVADRARFRVEAEAVARLHHPNIVQVYDIGEVDGCPYYSMEYVEGGSLADRAQAEALPPRQAAEILEALARAMHHAHQTDVIHRDLKPANVLLAMPQASIVPKITDFGLARLLDADATRTAPGVILGTACYLAPEQATPDDHEIGPITDVYGLGAILYDLLTGRPPIERGSWEVMLERVRTQEPADPSGIRPEVDRDLEAVCLKCLQKQPSRRYGSAQELADDLRRFLDGKPTAARPLGWTGRMGRRVRRHPFAAGVLMLLVLIAAILPFAAYYLNPERIPRDNLRDLEHGRAVILIGDNGPPRWSHWLLGEEVPIKAKNHPEAFSFSTLQHRLLELMPALPDDGYRFSAEICHEEKGGMDDVGLYFAYSKHGAGDDEEMTFWAITFNDWAFQPVRQDGTAGTLKLSGWRYNARTEFHATTLAIKEHPFRTANQSPPESPARPDWRRLAVEVRPDQIEIYWEGNSVGIVTVAQMDWAFRIQNVELAKHHPPVPPLHPEFHPRQGIGLFLFRGTASFRKVVVEPL